MSDGLSPGETGGIIAGIVALLGLIGAGIKWLGGYVAGRDVSRSKKLQVWHDELDGRERDFEARQNEYRLGIERRLAHVEGSNRALLRAVEVVTAALRVIDPGNNAISHAEQILNAAFPVDYRTPEDMNSTVSSIRESRPPRRNRGGK